MLMTPEDAKGLMNVMSVILDKESFLHNNNLGYNGECGYFDSNKERSYGLHLFIVTIHSHI